MHWACAKITASLAIPDATLLEILLDKVPLPLLKLCCNHHILCNYSWIVFFYFQLKVCKGISYAAVAAHADKNGRRKLAALLVEHEPRSSKQVEFLFSSYFGYMLN